MRIESEVIGETTLRFEVPESLSDLAELIRRGGSLIDERTPGQVKSLTITSFKGNATVRDHEGHWNAFGVSRFVKTYEDQAALRAFFRAEFPDARVRVFVPKADAAA